MKIVDSLEDYQVGGAEGDDIGPDLGKVQILGDAAGEIEGPAVGSGVGPEEGSSLKIDLLQGHQVG